MKINHKVLKKYSFILFFTILCPLIKSHSQILEKWDYRDCIKNIDKLVEIERNTDSLVLPMDNRIILKSELDSFCAVIRAKQKNNTPLVLITNSTKIIFYNRFSLNRFSNKYEYFILSINQDNKSYNEHSAWNCCYLPKYGFIYFFFNGGSVLEEAIAFRLKKSTNGITSKKLYVLYKRVLKKFFLFNCFATTNQNDNRGSK